jgi:hypothetical protein
VIDSKGDTNDTKVILLDAAPAVLGAFGDKVSTAAREQLAKIGVEQPGDDAQRHLAASGPQAVRELPMQRLGVRHDHDRAGVGIRGVESVDAGQMQLQVVPPDGGVRVGPELLVRRREAQTGVEIQRLAEVGRGQEG